MADDALVNLYNWCKSERSNLQKQVDLMRTGKFKTHEDAGNGLIDTTQRNIERVERNIVELNKLIADYEGSKRAEA